MKQLLITLTTVALSTTVCTAQIQTSSKRDTLVQKTIPPKKLLVQPSKPTNNTNSSIYSLSSAKVTIQTGNDNKEPGANMIFFFREKDGIWGKGSDLFQGGTTSELKINSNYDLWLDKVAATASSSYTLDNLQARGLYFAVYYRPNFFADAWKISSITITLEFKDQYGTRHPNFGNWVVQYNIANGLLTNSKWLLKATADGISFTPSPVTISNQF